MGTGTGAAHDTAIMQASQRGCPSALAELYERYERPLSAYARRRLDDRMDAEDLVQETILRLWRSSASFDVTKGSLDCLTFTIASRVLIDVLRRRGRQVPTAPLDNVEPESPDDEAARTDLAMTMVGALQALRPEQRQVLELAYFGGRTQRDIAALTDLPLGTVKTRTFAALRSMRALLVDQAA